MAFNRYEILFNHYKSQIEKEYYWDKIDIQARENCYLDEEGNIIASCFVGSVFSINPSGKYWTFWACSNVTRAEQTKDRAYNEALEEVLEEKGYFLSSGEGDLCDVFFQKVIEPSEVIHYVTSDDASRAEELFGA